MSLPPGFLDELRNRTSLSQVVGRKVMWDPRKSNQAKGDMWAPCPFHQEKTASFHVDDRKGFYYCFGCHAKGDAITFVKETENVPFMEAVEILAREAGLPMPARDPKAQQKADRRTQIGDVMEQAVKFFRLQLATTAAGPARAYLQKRGLAAEAQARWEIGFAPDGWQRLWDHLQGKGIDAQLILDAGLAKPSTTGKRPYDTFRNRIMFPIRDAQGRAIAFGGRAMDPTDNAKYLNSPETLLFDKGRSLYNHGPARQAAGTGQPLLVAEGYMDVIALAEAGFSAAVAPLGTAITEHQLQMLWRISPEPIIALDGDIAGLRAAMRVIDLALPLLEAGQSLRFAMMPKGKDPDDVLRDQGPETLQSILDDAVPMVRLLWQRETEGKLFDSPERKAALDKALRDKLKLIKDVSIRAHYAQDIKDLRWDLFRTTRPATRGAGFTGKARVAGPVPGTKASMLVAGDDGVTDQMRVAVILASLIATPTVIAEFETDLETLDCRNDDHAALRNAILRHGLSDPRDLRAAISDDLGARPLEKLFALRHVSVSPCLRKPGDDDLARATVAQEFDKLKAQKGLAAEIDEAQEDMIGFADESVTFRLDQAARAMDRATRSTTEDRTQYETGANGARIDRSEREKFEDLLNRIGFAKPPQ